MRNFFSFRHSHNQCRRGFTLVEMAITATIMIITSSMLIVFSQSGGNRLVLAAEEAKIGGALNRAKSLALQRYRVDDGMICGFGFKWNDPKDTYALFSVMRNELSGICDEEGEITESFELNSQVSFLPSESGIIIFESPYLTTQNPTTVRIALKSDLTDPVGVEVTSGGAIIAH